MMTYPHNSLEEIKNKISAEDFLEFAVHILQQIYFNPIVFCHDAFWFNKDRFSQVMIGFINLLYYLDSCGIMLETETVDPSDIQTELYRQIMCDSDFSGGIVCYELIRADFSDLNISTAGTPVNCESHDFALVKLYLMWKTGAALNKKAIERLIEKSLTDSEVQTIRKKFERITGNRIIKRKDNSYEMRCANE